MKTLPAIDYLSTVSGGRIWRRMLARPGNLQDDVYGNPVQSHDPGELLDSHGDFITQLRHPTPLLRFH